MLVRLGRILLAALAGLMLVSLAGSFSLQLDSLQVGVSFRPALTGTTAVSLPPFGQISAVTHKVPLQVTVTWENVNLENLSDFAGHVASEKEFLDHLKPSLYQGLRLLLVKVLLLAAMGGSLAAAALRCTGLRDFLASTAAAAVLVAGLLGGVAATYDVSRFGNPNYEGMLQMAPWAIGLAQEAMANMDSLNQQMQAVAENVADLFSRLENGPVPGTEAAAVKLLHVSDLHNNPAAYPLIRAVSEKFKVDLIVDTGDITDLGTPLEAKMTEQIKATPIPYIFVPGNHDSPEVVASLKKLPNVKVLDQEMVQVKGLTILGQADPSSYSNALTPPGEEKIQEIVAGLQEFLAGSANKPTVIAVHNNRLARALAGEAEVILYGHDHRLNIERVRDSWLVDAGTTGAAGIRGLAVTHDVPYTLVVLYFQPDGEGRLKPSMADIIKVSDKDNGFSLERQVF
ncbi:MAG: hypothetical protein D9V47_06140 [Clostridia bacterium]|nr:MAG: hypothetical protein D9V47_06140 [Clostridia bacterium]